jgi:hypothetical protein
MAGDEDAGLRVQHPPSACTGWPAGVTGQLRLRAPDLTVQAYVSSLQGMTLIPAMRYRGAHEREGANFG